MSVAVCLTLQLRSAAEKQMPFAIWRRFLQGTTFLHAKSGLTAPAPLRYWIATEIWCPKNRKNLCESNICYTTSISGNCVSTQIDHFPVLDNVLSDACGLAAKKRAWSTWYFTCIVDLYTSVLNWPCGWTRKEIFLQKKNSRWVCRPCPAAGVKVWSALFAESSSPHKFVWITFGRGASTIWSHHVRFLSETDVCIDRTDQFHNISSSLLEVWGLMEIYNYIKAMDLRFLSMLWLKIRSRKGNCIVICYLNAVLKSQAYLSATGIFSEFHSKFLGKCQQHQSRFFSKSNKLETVHREITYFHRSRSPQTNAEFSFPTERGAILLGVSQTLVLNVSMHGHSTCLKDLRRPFGQVSGLTDCRRVRVFFACASGVLWSLSSCNSLW